LTISPVGSFADYGVGGNEIERKGLRDALSLLKDGQADLLVTVNVSRLSRSVGALAKLVDAHFSTGEHGLVTLEEQIDTRTPCGHFMLSLCRTLCQFEVEATGHA
jgi:DNA invertase Pin-like site-specific DNA recombinase